MSKEIATLIYLLSDEEHEDYRAIKEAIDAILQEAPTC